MNEHPKANETALEYLERVWGEDINDLDPLTESDIRYNARCGYKLDQELVDMLNEADTVRAIDWLSNPVEPRKLTITLDLENAAFDDPDREIARILSDLSRVALTDGFAGNLFPYSILDINGNTVGHLVVEEVG